MVSEITEDREYMECVGHIVPSCIPVHGPVHTARDYHYVRPTVYRFHTLDISCANSWGGNWRSAARAGLLHELFYMIGILMLRREASTFMDSPIPRQPWVNADRYFRLTGEERMIILRHMWPLTLVPPHPRQDMQLLVRINIAVQWKPRPGLSTGFGCACLHSRPDGNLTFCCNRPGARLKGERIIRL